MSREDPEVGRRKAGARAGATRATSGAGQTDGSYLPRWLEVAKLRSRRLPVAWIILGLGLATQMALLGHSGHVNAAAFDEGMHIAAGHRYWECADFGINPEHPPLVKLLAAFPVRRWPFAAVFGRACGQRPTRNAELLADGYRLVSSPRGDETVRAARRALLVIPATLTLVVFLATRAWFGSAAACLAVVLVAFEPNLAAHGPLATTDAALALATLLSVTCAWWAAARPSAARWTLLGVTLGLALASKHSGILVPPIVGLELVWLAAARPQGRSWAELGRLLAGWAAACALGAIVLWGTYGFRFEALPPGAERGFDLEGRESDGAFNGAVVLAARARLLPESYLAGLAYVRDNAVREAFLLGRELESGTWSYFPVALAVKTTLPLLVLVGSCIVSWRPLRARNGPALVVVALPVAVFLAAAMASRMNIGVRHVLPVYPFLVILAAASAALWLRRSRLGMVVVVTLLAWHVGSALASHPDEIAYANEAWGGPSRLHRILGDSNVDWGQALPRVREYVATHDVGTCWIAWFGMRKPVDAGVPCRPLPGPMFLDVVEPQLPPVAPSRIAGTVFVSATLTQYGIYPYTSFRGRDPVDVVGGGVLVFEGAFDLQEAAADRRGARGWWLLNRGRIDEARAELELACAASDSRIVADLARAVSAEGCRR